MSNQSGYRLHLLTNAELNDLRDCYADTGEHMPERVTPELEAALRRVAR